MTGRDGRRRVLHVNFSDYEGGAARAAFRLHAGLRKAGADSRMAVINRTLDDPDVVAPLGAAGIWRARINRRVERQLLAREKNSNLVAHSLALLPTGLGRWINASDADVVNLHWMGAGMISIGEIAAIRKPVVWTMHDMWPFSGAEHYENPFSPGRSACGYSTESREPGDNGPDLDRWTFRRKRKSWAGRTFHLASPSRWLAECAGRSVLFGSQTCRVLPNGIDMADYKPVERAAARRAFNLPQDKKLVLFGAMSSTADRRKGFHLLVPALRWLSEQNEYADRTEVVVFGASHSDADIALPAHFVGRIDDDERLSLLYSAADVFVAPSLQDNLPNTLVEAMACGTPCVAFRIGGMPDLIPDERCGQLIDPIDFKALGQGIAKTLQTDSAAARNACRANAARYDNVTAAQGYLDYYESILASR